MEGLSRGLRVQVFLAESGHDGKKAPWQGLLEHLRKEGAAGVTVTRGIAGFGAASRIHTTAILDVAGDLPIVLTWIDSAERVERILPSLRELARGGLITVDEVHVARYEPRHLDQLRFDLPVRDVMSKPARAVREDVSSRAAAEMLIGHGHRALPVVDAEERPVGVITNADLVIRAGMPARLRILEGLDATRRRELLDAMPPEPVSEAMTRGAVTVSEGATLADAARLMADRKLKRLPVVGGDGRLVGVISRADILRAVAESFPREAQAGGPHTGRTAGEIMRLDAPVVRDDDPLEKVIDVVISTSLNRAVVVDANRHVLGVISDTGVLAAADAASHSKVLGALMRSTGIPRLAGPRAREIAVETPVAQLDTPLHEVAHVMLEQRLRLVPVVDAEGRLAGVVGRATLLQASRVVLDDLDRGEASVGILGGDDDDGA